jgi:hypothetical protein
MTESWPESRTLNSTNICLPESPRFFQQETNTPFVRYPWTPQRAHGFLPNMKAIHFLSPECGLLRDMRCVCVTPKCNELELHSGIFCLATRYRVIFRLSRKKLELTQKRCGLKISNGRSGSLSRRGYPELQTVAIFCNPELSIMPSPSILNWYVAPIVDKP